MLWKRTSRAFVTRLTRSDVFWACGGSSWVRVLLQHPHCRMETRNDLLTLAAGHTPNLTGIRSRCKGKVLLIDSMWCSLLWRLANACPTR